MSIIETRPGHFVASAHQTWLPGVYASRRAANYAFRLNPEELEHVWTAHLAKHGTPAPPITFEEMQAHRRQRPA